jgi:hypothetical protein
MAQADEVIAAKLFRQRVDVAAILFIQSHMLSMMLRTCTLLSGSTKPARLGFMGQSVITSCIWERSRQPLFPSVQVGSAHACNSSGVGYPLFKVGQSLLV